MNWQVIELVAQHKLDWNIKRFGPWTFFSCIAAEEGPRTEMFCIPVKFTAEDGPWTETLCIPVKFMLCYKLNNLPVHHRHSNEPVRAHRKRYLLWQDGLLTACTYCVKEQNLSSISLTPALHVCAWWWLCIDLRSIVHWSVWWFDDGQVQPQMTLHPCCLCMHMDTVTHRHRNIHKIIVLFF